jgi:hypothetical protein
VISDRVQNHDRYGRHESFEASCLLSLFFNNYKNPQLKFRDLWVVIVNKEVVVADESIKYVEEKASKLTGKGKEEIPVIFVESCAHVY